MDKFDPCRSWGHFGSPRLELDLGLHGSILEILRIRSKLRSFHFKLSRSELFLNISGRALKYRPFGKSYREFNVFIKSNSSLRSTPKLMIV